MALNPKALLVVVTDEQGKMTAYPNARAVVSFSQDFESHDAFWALYAFARDKRFGNPEIEEEIERGVQRYGMSGRLVEVVDCG